MKFHYSNLKDRIKLVIYDTRKYLSLIFNLLIIFLTIIIFLPVKLMSFGFMKKLSNYLLDLQSTILEYFVSKIFFTFYCC